MKRYLLAFILALLAVICGYSGEKISEKTDMTNLSFSFIQKDFSLNDNIQRYKSDNDKTMLFVASGLSVILTAGVSVLSTIPASILTSYYYTIIPTFEMRIGSIVSWALYGGITLASIVFTVFWFIYFFKNARFWSNTLLILEILFLGTDALIPAIVCTALYSITTTIETLVGMIVAWASFGALCISLPILGAVMIVKGLSLMPQSNKLKIVMKPGEIGVSILL